MKTYVTFGYDHVHDINGKIFDKDCVAVVNGDRAKVFELFGREFCFEYPENYWDDGSIIFYPRGYIEVDSEAVLPEIKASQPKGEFK